MFAVTKKDIKMLQRFGSKSVFCRLLVANLVDIWDELLNHNNVSLLNNGVRLILYQHLVGLTSVVVNQVTLHNVLNLGARHNHAALPVPQ